MIIEAISVIPEVFGPYMEASILGRAQARHIFEFRAHDLRDWTHDRHRTVDDAPFGGGPGMLMKPEPLFEAVRSVQAQEQSHARCIFFTPTGAPFTQATAMRLAAYDRLLMVCGRYEGMDDRVYELADECISLGDYVLTGGEVAAMAVTDAVVRLLPGALGDDASSVSESFSDGLLEYAQYTRPASFEGREVPAVLLSGDHAKVDQWRRRNAIERTFLLRPDLLDVAALSPDEQEFVQKLKARSAQDL